MLATHGIVVCSALGAAAIQRTMLEVFAISHWLSRTPDTAVVHRMMLAKKKKIISVNE